MGKEGEGRGRYVTRAIFLKVSPRSRVDPMQT